MNKIVVNSAVMDEYTSDIRSLGKMVEGIGARTGAVSVSLSWLIPGSAHIRASIAAAANDIGRQGGNVCAASAALGKVSGSYKRTEETNKWAKLSDSKWSKLLELIGSLPQPGIPGAGFFPAFVPLSLIAPLWRELFAGDLSFSVGGAAKTLSSGDGSALLEFLGWSSTTSLAFASGYKNDEAFDSLDQKKKDIYQLNKDDPWYEKEATIAELEWKAEREATLLHGSLSADGKYAESSIDVKVGTAEAHKSISAGLYVYKTDKDGNVQRILSPGVAAEVGASAALLTLDTEARIGLGEDHNMLGVYGKSGVRVASAEAQAQLGINRNEVHGKVSLEADLVKAEGSAGVSVLGTDIGVSGSVKVGVGFHADVGYTNGKFKVDVGAALGVGADLGFEVDVSGTIDAICSNAESIWNAAGDVVNAAGDVIGSIGDGIASLWPF